MAYQISGDMSRKIKEMVTDLVASKELEADLVAAMQPVQEAEEEKLCCVCFKPTDAHMNCPCKTPVCAMCVLQFYAASGKVMCPYCKRSPKKLSEWTREPAQADTWMPIPNGQPEYNHPDAGDIFVDHAIEITVNAAAAGQVPAPIPFAGAPLQVVGFTPTTYEPMPGVLVFNVDTLTPVNYEFVLRTDFMEPSEKLWVVRFKGAGEFETVPQVLRRICQWKTLYSVQFRVRGEPFAVAADTRFCDLLHGVLLEVEFYGDEDIFSEDALDHPLSDFTPFDINIVGHNARVEKGILGWLSLADIIFDCPDGFCHIVDITSHEGFVNTMRMGDCYEIIGDIMKDSTFVIRCVEDSDEEVDV